MVAIEDRCEGTILSAGPMSVSVGTGEGSTEAWVQFEFPDMRLRGRFDPVSLSFETAGHRAGNVGVEFSGEFTSNGMVVISKAMLRMVAGNCNFWLSAVRDSPPDQG